MINEINNKSEGKTEEEQAQVRAMLQAKLNAPPDPPLEAAKKFFNAFFSDEDWEEARERLIKRTALNPRSVLAGLAGVEGLLVAPPLPSQASCLRWWPGTLTGC